MKTETETPFFGEFGDSITFNSVSECRSDALQIAWHPASIKFRESKGQQERFFLNLYLKWAFKKDAASFDLPLIITRADKKNEPDFFITENGRQYGLEVTRATTWRSERATDALIAAGPGCFLEIDSSIFGEDRDYKPISDIKSPGDGLDSEPLLGLDLEKEWARCTGYRILEKQKKLAKNYSLFTSECDLVLYSSFPIHELEDGVRFLQSHYKSAETSGNSCIRFQRIAIVSENWAIFDPLGATPLVLNTRDFPFDGSPEQARMIGGLSGKKFSS